MGPNTTNLFTLLTLIVAPAVLTNASSVLALNTANRIGRVVDRSRELAGHIAAEPHATEVNAMRRRQIDRLRTRARLLMRAQTRFYIALGLFVAMAPLSILGAILALEGFAAYVVVGVIGFAAGASAAIILISGAILVARETRHALAVLIDEELMIESLLPPTSSTGNGPTS